MSEAGAAFPKPIRVGVTINPVTTLCNVRGGRHPDPLRAASRATFS